LIFCDAVKGETKIVQSSNAKRLGSRHRSKRGYLEKTGEEKTGSFPVEIGTKKMKRVLYGWWGLAKREIGDIH